MQEQVKVQVCTNPLVLDFISERDISQIKLCVFFTKHNLEFSQCDLDRVGLVAEQIVCEVLEYRDIRQIFISTNRLTVVLKTGKIWETLPDQILRIIEKAIEEYELS